MPGLPSHPLEMMCATRHCALQARESRLAPNVVKRGTCISTKSSLVKVHCGQVVRKSDFEHLKELRKKPIAYTHSTTTTISLIEHTTEQYMYYKGFAERDQTLSFSKGQSVDQLAGYVEQVELVKYQAKPLPGPPCRTSIIARALLGAH